MTEKFKELIQDYKEPIFYNSTGSTEAYKLCVRHLSAAMNMGLAKLSNGYIFPNNVLYIVDLENENIVLIRNGVKLIKLEVLK